MFGILLDVVTAPATQSSAVDFTWLFVKMMGALFIVCIFAVVVLKYAVPKIGYFKKFAGSRHISIVARHSVDHRRHLYIIRVGQKYALVGATDHGMNLIMELKPEDVEGAAGGGNI